MIGYFKAGLCHGPCITIHKDGFKEVETWKDGCLIGEAQKIDLLEGITLTKKFNGSLPYDDLLEDEGDEMLGWKRKE